MGTSLLERKPNIYLSITETVRVDSGVPQGTVLAPLLFLLFDDIAMEIDSHLRLFADDCLLYEEVNDSVMAENLQKEY